jgi:hypothetical protein
VPTSGRDDHLREESIFGSMVEAIRRRDLAALERLLVAEVELRSYSTGLELVRGRPLALAAVQAHEQSLYDPTLTRFEHLGDGWMIVSARIRHSLPGGGMADSAKTLLARVVGDRVRLSLVFNLAADAWTEYERRAGLESVAPPRRDPTSGEGRPNVRPCSAAYALVRALRVAVMLRPYGVPIAT